LAKNTPVVSFKSNGYRRKDTHSRKKVTKRRRGEWNKGGKAPPTYNEEKRSKLALQ